MDKNNPKAIKVLVADDQYSSRRRLREALDQIEDIEVVGEADNGQQAVELVQKLAPHVVLMDVAMPIMNGIEAAKQIQANNGDVNILMLISLEDRTEIYAAFSSGATGYGPKNMEPEHLALAVSALKAGEFWIAPTIASEILQYSNSEFFRNAAQKLGDATN